MEYDEIQADAIRKAAVSKVMVLTGGPGPEKPRQRRELSLLTVRLD